MGHGTGWDRIGQVGTALGTEWDTGQDTGWERDRTGCDTGWTRDGTGRAWSRDETRDWTRTGTGAGQDTRTGAEPPLTDRRKFRPSVQPGRTHWLLRPARAPIGWRRGRGGASGAQEAAAAPRRLFLPAAPERSGPGGPGGGGEAGPR